MGSGFTTQALNFSSATSGGIDPRTGLFNLQLVVGELTGNHNQGPCFKAILGYSPLQRRDLGYGIGFSLGHSHFDSDRGMLALSNGEQYRVAGKEDPIILQKHTDHFKFDCVVLGGQRFYRIRWKDGSVEILAGPDTGDVLKMPLRTFTPAGHGLIWTWSAGEVNQFPRLEAITDDTGATLMEVESRKNVSSTLTLWPGTPDQFKVVLWLTNNYLTEILRADLRTTLGYDAVGSSGDSETMSYLTRIEHATGLVEEVRYDSEAMHFPSAAQLAALPAVVQHILVPGAGQPNIVRKFDYSENNYLAGGYGGEWSPDLDPLYAIAVEYEYWSRERLIVDKAEHSVTVRTYNNFHLQTREEARSGHCVSLHETTYYARVGEALEQQPKYFLLPRQQIFNWTDESKPSEKQSRTETTNLTFDDAGNPLTQVEPDGTRTEYAYYPAEGEKDDNQKELCPGEPNGFVRLLKSVTVSAPLVRADVSEAPLTVPVTQFRYTYCLLAARAGAPFTSVVLQSSEQQFVDNHLMRKIVREHVDDPREVEHCRLQGETTTLYCYSGESPQAYETKRTFNLTVRPNDRHVLAQTVTSVAHDGLQITEKRMQSLQSGRLLEEEDHQCLRTTYAYDTLGRLVCKKRNAGTIYEHVTRYTHEKRDGGLFSTREDALGNRTRSKFDGLGRVVESWQWDIDGPSRRWVELGKCSYDAVGRLALREAYDWTMRESDGSGITRTERFGYDQWGQTETVETVDGLKHVRQYDPVTRTQTRELVATDGTRTAVHEIMYDVRGRPWQECEYLVDGSTRTLYSKRQKIHDAWGRLRKDIDELGRITRYEYDMHSRVSRVELADRTSILKDYAVFTEQPLIRAISVQIGRPPGVQRVGLGERAFDGLGRLKSSECGGRLWSYEYKDATATSPCSVIAPDGVTREYEYIPELNNAISDVRAKRQWWHFLNPGVEQTFKHDLRTGAVTEAKTKPNSVVTQLAYHPSGRLKGEAQAGVDGQTRSTTHGYSLGGRLTDWTDVGGAQQKYEYDQHGRLVAIADPAVRVDLNYDVLGRLKRWVATDLASTPAHTLTTTLRLDAFGREIQRTIRSSQGQTWAIAQKWQANHQLCERIWSFGGKARRREAYEYDARNRLVTYNCSGVDIPLNEFGKRVTRKTFVFDALDNITQCISEFEEGTNTAIFKHSEKDACQLVGVTNTHDAWPRKLDLEYDDAGRMVLNEHGQKLSYDEMGRLVSIESSEHRSEYGYDAWDRLISQKTGSQNEMLYYRAEELVNRISGTAADQRHRLVRMGPVSLAQKSEGTHEATWLTGASDGHEVVAAINGNQHLEYVYGPYGEAKDDVSGLPGYGGERRDTVSGAYHLGNGYRAYSPILMRFTCPDDLSPFGAGGINPYAYCAGDPVNRADHSGHLSWQAWTGIGLGALGLALTVYTAGASIAAAGGILAAINSASTMSLAVGTAGMVADVTAIASGAVEDIDPKASAVLGWVSLSAGAIGIASASAVFARHMTSRATTVSWGSDAKLLKSEMKHYVFEDQIRGERRLNVMAHTVTMSDRLHLELREGWKAGPTALAVYLRENIEELDKFASIRLIACYGANGGPNSFAAKLAGLLGKRVKAYEGIVTTQAPHAGELYSNSSRLNIIDLRVKVQGQHQSRYFGPDPSLALREHVRRERAMHDLLFGPESNIQPG